MVEYVRRFNVADDSGVKRSVYVRDATLGDTVDKLARLDVRPFLSSMIEGSSALFVGDSYTYGTGASDHLSGDTKRWSSIVSAALGLNEINVAVGSTGFVDPGSSGQNMPFITQYNTWYNSASSATRSSVKAVFIAGGFNDVFYDNATYTATQTAARTLLNRVITTLPNAAIIFVPMLWRGYGYTVKARNLYNALCKAALTCSRPDRVTCIKNAFTWTAYVDDIYRDGIHPNDTGHAHIAQGVLQGINDPAGASSDTWNTTTYNDYVSSAASNMMERIGGICYRHQSIIYFNDAIASNVTIGQVPPEFVPRQNLYSPVFSSNSVAGSIAIVGAEAASGTPGSLHVIPSSSLTSCFVPSFSWEWFGAQS